MAFSITPVTRTRVEIDNMRGKVDFTVAMPDHQLRQFMLMAGNPLVSKIYKVKWFRDMLGIGLRESLCFVEEAQAFYEHDYRPMKEYMDGYDPDPEVEDYRNNHGQDD
jgi:hypothetical protein